MYKSTNKLLEMQSDATKGTLIKNAIALGYKNSEIEEKEISAEDYELLIKNQPKSKDEINNETMTQINLLELSLLRPLREMSSTVILDKSFAQKKIDDTENKISALRSDLIK